MDGEAKSEVLTSEELSAQPMPAAIGRGLRLCAVCGHRLEVTNAKVHKGSCARRRKTLRQKRRRQDARVRGAVVT